MWQSLQQQNFVVEIFYIIMGQKVKSRLQLLKGSFVGFVVLVRFYKNLNEFVVDIINLNNNEWIIYKEKCLYF